MEHFFPHADLNASIDSVYSRLQTISSPRSRPEIKSSLLTSVTIFIKRELHRATMLPENCHSWHDLFQPCVFAVTRPDVETLLPFARRRVFQWKRALLELLQRLETDWADIAHHFGIDLEATLDAISPPLGDLHNGGRAVYGVRFSDGRALVYKPRPIDPETTFYRLLVWLQEKGYQPDLTTCRGFGRAGYGWTEYVSTTLCRTESEILAFHRRQGAYLALFWRLCGTDVIADNLVVSGQRPIWIDTECLFRPELPQTLYDTSGFPSWMRESILTTGMIPVETRKRNRLRDRSGLSRCCAVDRADVFTEDGRLKEPCVCNVVQGFQEGYLWLLKHQRSRAQDTDLTNRCGNICIRVILKDTYLYEILLSVLTITPTRHQVEMCQTIRNILRHGRGHGEVRTPYALVDADIQALSRGDIPYWSAATNSHDLREAGGCRVPSIIRRTSLESLARRGARMSEGDLSRQAWLLESLLRSAYHTT